MGSHYKRAASAVALADKKLDSPSTEGEIAFLTFDIVNALEQEPIFSELDGGIYVSRGFDQRSLQAVAHHLVRSGIRREVARRFIQAVDESRGKWLADLLGFAPHSAQGQEIIPSEVDIHFGKLYLPPIEGFTAIVETDNAADSQYDLTLKLPCVGAGGNKIYQCRFNHKRTLDNIPVNLVIPAAVKIVEWRHPSGESFPTLYIVNTSRSIVGRVADNPYDSDTGYRDICRLPGTVDRFDTRTQRQSEEVSEAVRVNTRIGLTLSIALHDAVSLNMKGLAVVNKQFKINYSLPPGHEYANFVKHRPDFQHLWAIKR